VASPTLERWVPGLRVLRTYRREWLQSDLLAGISLAAVALPIGIAYAELAGFPAVAGIYSAILPAVAYALFGTSRQLVVNPDAAACAIVAATVGPLVASDPSRYVDVAITLTFLTGLLCIAGGLAGLGVIADFLSRPILTGYLNGIALSIIVGQLGTMMGLQIPKTGFLRPIVGAVSHAREAHVLTLAVGVGLFVLLRVFKHFWPRLPGPLIGVILGILLVYAMGLVAKGVVVVGEVPAGFPMPTIPHFKLAEVRPLIESAVGIMLVSFCSMMTTARGFANKNGYQIDANQDMIALGFSDIAAGLSRGFVVSGADSRTAVADTSGGKTQLTSVVAALAMALVLLFLTRPLAILPKAALAAILMSSAIGLFDIASLRRYFRLSPAEFWFSIVAMVGVIVLGVLHGVLIAVALTLLRLIALASRPRDGVLGELKGQAGVYAPVSEEGGIPIRGLLLYRFESAIIFFNSDYFKDRVHLALAEANPKPKWFLFNAESTPALDITGAETLEELRAEFAEQGIVFGIARPRGRFEAMLRRTGLAERIGADRIFPTIGIGVAAYRIEAGE
jgi:high affinity sulfate transporter 1